MKDKTEYLNSLIDRIGDDNLRQGETLPEDTSFDSSLTVSWEARNEAKKLDNADLIEPLKILLLNEKEARKRTNIIWVLILLAEKNDVHEISDFILDKLKSEKTQRVKSSILESLAFSDLKVTNELNYIFELMQDKNSHISDSAIKILAKSSDASAEKAEETCLKLLDKYANKPHSLRILCDVLKTYGSKNSLNKLKLIAKNNNKSFVKISAMYAIADIDGQNQVEFFKEMLVDSKNIETKGKASYFLCQFADENHIEILISRVKSILSKKRKSNFHYTEDSKPEIVYILEFLMKFDDKRVKKLIDFIAVKKLDFLDETELNWLKQNIDIKL